MDCFKLRANTVDGGVFDFTMNDLPTPVSSSEFVLIGRPSTPILLIDYVLRGDPETGLYEGETIREPDGSVWLVCYERGFYLINEDYVVKYFSDLTDWELTQDKLNIPISYKKEHLFKYKKLLFKFRSIVGATDGKLLINSTTEPIDPDTIQQDCCMCIEQKRIFLGDRVKSGRIALKHGRLVTRTSKDKYVLL